MHRLLDNHAQILIDMGDVMKSDLKKNDAAADIDQQTDNFLSDMSLLMETLDCIVSYITRPKIQATDEECDNLERTCKYFGWLWRDKLKVSVPHKLHLLESHVPISFRYLRNLGDFTEDSIERLHHQVKVYNRVYANIESWERKTQVMHSKANQARTPSVISSISQNTLSGKRTLSQSSINIKLDKQDQEKSAKISNQQHIHNKGDQYLTPG